MNKLFIIGNGFDIAHSLPTAYNPHFKEMAERIEQISYFGIFIKVEKLIYGLILRIV